NSYTVTATAYDSCGNVETYAVNITVSYEYGVPDSITISGPSDGVGLVYLTVRLEDDLGQGVPGEAGNITVTSDRNGTVPEVVFDDDFEADGDFPGWTQINDPDAVIDFAFGVNPLDVGSTFYGHFDTQGGVWKVIDLSGYEDIELSYQIMSTGLEVAQFDTFYVEYSTDGGGSWIPLDVGVGLNQAWVEKVYDLSSLEPAVEHNYRFALRFRLAANGADDHFVVDNVVLSGVPAADIIGSPVDEGDGDYTVQVSTCSLGLATFCASWNSGVLFTDGVSPNSGCAQVDFVSPTVQIVDPVDLAVLNASDDKDGNPVNGLQYDVTVSTDAPDGSTVLLTVGGITPPLVGLVSGGGVTFTGADFPEGLVVEVDALVEVCSGPGSDVSTVLVDTIAPVASIDSPSFGACIGTTVVVVDGSATDFGGSGVKEVTVQAGVYSATGADFPINLVVPADGTYTITAWAEDDAGNIGLVDTVANVRVDTAAPEVSISLPVSGDCIETSVVVVDGSVTESGSGVKEITVQAGAYSVTSNTFPIDLIIPADGVYTITVWVEDDCGNIGQDTVGNVRVDTAAPVVVIESPTLDECINSSVVVVGGSVVEAGSGVKEITVQAGVYSATGSFFPITLNIPVDGVYTINAWAEDDCGNVGPVDTAANVRVDTIDPVVGIDSPVSGEYVGTSAVVVDGSVTDFGGSGVKEVTVQAGAYSATGSSFPIALDIPVNGVYDITVWAEDSCGNISLVDTVMDVYVDTVGPTVSITIPVSGSTLNQTTVTVEGTAGDTLPSSGLRWVVVNGETAFGTSSWMVVLSGLAQGTNTLEATVSDNAGNIGTDQVVVFIDSVAPVVSITSPTPGAFRRSATVRVTGTVTDALPSSGITEVWVDGVTAAISGTDWTATLEGLPEGSVTVTVRAYDVAGNEGLAAVNITVDTIVPTVSITIPTSGSIFNQTTVVVEGTASDAPPSSGLEKVVVNGQAAFGTDSWMVIISGLAEGWNSLTATVWDNAGNYSFNSVDILVDTIAPVVNVSSPTVGKCINTETVVVDGTITETGSGVELVTVTAIGPAVFSATGVSFPVNLTVTVDGLYSISVVVNDEAGNLGVPVLVSNVRVDRVVDGVALLGPVSGSCVNSTVVSVTGTAWDVGSGILQVDVTAVGPATFIATAADFSVPIDLSITTDGVYDISATVWDNCGNMLVSGPLTSVEVDTVLPVVSIISPTDGECITTSTVSVDASSDGGELVSCTI
ncbi:MAG: hypothetical protein JSU92_13470, partial [Deltaproteobacteria bacterium]